MSCDELPAAVQTQQEEGEEHLCFPAGLDCSRELVAELTAQAVSALDGFASPDFLVWLANTLAQRTK